MNTGFERACQSPHTGFTQSAIPTPTARGRTAAQGRGDLHVHVQVGGDIIGVDDFERRMLRNISLGIVEGRRQQDRAMGVVEEASGAVPGWTGNPRPLG